ncbi:MAG: hypothetical protein KDA25_11000, partial [Phycisphaerales bacterium]|nr:hypothetical protein [Phycisphaerales bacterium]
VLAGHVDICDRLWAAEAVATGPRSLLVCAVQSGRPAMVQSLLDRGFGPSDRRERDDLLLTAAETSVEMTAFIHDRARWSVHNRAAALGRAIEVGNEPVVEFLLGAGVSPTCEYKTHMGCLVSRHTPLSIAVERYGCFPRLLPRLLADADVIPHSVLEAAVRSGSTDALDRLIEAGADPRSVGNRSRTLWWVAADRPDLWPYLLEIGVDPNRPDASGQRPGTRNEGLRRFLREHAVDPAASGD